MTTDELYLPDSLLEQIAEEGLGILPELIRIVINTAMQAEREQYLGAYLRRVDTRRGMPTRSTVTRRVAEMYVQGVSTRKVAAITEQLCDAIPRRR